MGSRRWSIFTGGERGLGAQGGSGGDRRKGPFGPSLVAQIRELGKTSCVWVSGYHVRSEGWLGEREREQNHECRIQSCCSQRIDYLGSSSQEGKEMSVKFSGNIQSCNGVAVGFFALVKPILQLMFSLPSKLSLLISLDHPVCNLAVAAA